MLSRKTGISQTRLSELSNTGTAQLKVNELFLIALALEVSPAELLEWVCTGLRLKD